MKKILALVMAVAMILSVGVLCASARPAAYACGSKADFEPVGRIEIQWDPDAADKINVKDGDMSEWLENEYASTIIDQYNMISWDSLVHTGTTPGTDDEGNPITIHNYTNEVATKSNAISKGEGDPDSAMPEGWSITTYFVADKDYLYVGFYVTDPDVVAGAEGGAHYLTADAFQISVDFGNKLGDLIENDPDAAAELSSTKNIFYSFCYAGNGQPIVVDRAESDLDGTIGESDGVFGATAKTEQGWSAEFAISWERMYEDYAWKAYAEDNDRVVIGGPNADPLKLGIALYYQDHTNANGDPIQITWAAGTGTGRLAQNGAPQMEWDAKDNGISLELPIQEGLEFSCENIVIADASGELPETDPETDAPETDPETKAETDPAGDIDNKNDETNPETKAETKAPDTDKKDDNKKDDDGCGSIIGGATVALMAAAAAAVALKKKD